MEKEGRSREREKKNSHIPGLATLTSPTEAVGVRERDERKNGRRRGNEKRKMVSSSSL